MVPPRTPSARPSFEVFTDFAGCGLSREEWDEAVLALGGDVYLTWDWCHTWWRHYGRGRTLRVFVFRDQDRVVGLVPMFTETVVLGFVWVRIAKLVGSDFTTVVHHPPIPAEHAATIVRAVTQHLVDEDRCDAVLFGTLAGDHEATEIMGAALAEGLAGARLERDAVAAPHTLFELPETFDAYVQSFKRKKRSDIRRRLRRLTEKHGMVVDVVREGDEVEPELERFFEMHTAQWESFGKLGHFGDWPGSLAYHRDLVRDAAAAGRLQLVRIVVDGEVASYYLCFSFGDWCYWRLPARKTGGQWEEHSLGTYGLIETLRVAIDDGQRHFEAGVGHYEYKLRIGAQELGMRSLLVVSERPFSDLRCRAFVRLANALHTFYYRGWFLKLAPKLPFPRGSLWRSWIRSRM